jgi:LysM repeat protein
MDIKSYELVRDQDHLTLVVYLDPQLEEFGFEFGRSPKKKDHLQGQIQNLIVEKFPTVSIKTAKVMVGSFLVTTIYLGTPASTSHAQTTTPQVSQSEQYDVYVVQQGDTLYQVAKRFNVSVNSIKTVNGLTSDFLFVGQSLKLPYYTYTVVSGDTLYLIARKFNTTADSIRSYNMLSSNTIFIGQKIKIPRDSVPAATDNSTPSVENPVIPGTYTVAAGDTLYSIARKLNTTVDTLKTLNNLSTTAISIGQVLKVTEQPLTTAPAPTMPPTVSEPTPTPVPETTTPSPARPTTTYTVVSGDTLTIIAKKHNTTVTVIKQLNQLPTDIIYVGQRLTVPATTTVAPTDTIAPAVPLLNRTEVITTKNQGNFSISGSTEANAMVSIHVTDGANNPIERQIKADASGNFAVDIDVSKLIDGSIIVTTSATDAAGNRSADSRSIIKKDTSTTAPIIENKKPVSIDNVKNYPLFGLAEPGAQVEITISDGVNSNIVTTVTANGTGEYQTTVDLRTLNDGILTIRSQAIDQYGNSSALVQTTVTKATSLAAPVIENTKQINSQTANHYAIFGRAHPNSTVELIISDKSNQKVQATATADSNGQFHVNLNLSGLQDSALSITTVQTSLTGIRSQTGTTTIVKDTIAPSAPILNNNNFINQTNQKSFLLTGRGEPNTQVKIKVTNTTGSMMEVNERVSANGSYSIPVDLTGFNDGDIRFELTQIDVAGNESSLTIKTLLKDTVGPSILEIGKPPAIYSGNVNHYVLTGTAEPQISLDITLSDGISNITKTVTTDANGGFSLPFDMSSLKDGDIKVTFFATDTAGNRNELEPITLAKDTAAPVNTVIKMAPYVNSLNQNQFSITGSSEDKDSKVKIEVSDGITTITKTTTVNNNTFNSEIDVTSLKDGPLTVEMTQTDQAGNTGIVHASTIQKDTIAQDPAVSKNGFSIENQQQVFTVMGTAEPSATIKVSILDKSGIQLLSTAALADSKGFYSVKLVVDESTLSKAATAAVIQTDLAGNSSKSSSVALYGHQVASGDTLYTIAKRYNTTVDAIKALNHLTSDLIKPDQILRLPVSASEVINLGYMYFGNTSEYINQVNATNNAVNTVAPSYFDINKDGTLKLTYSIDPNFIAAMHQKGVRVVPFLSNHWDREVGRAMLANKEQAAQQIADAIARYQLDGVNVDIENVTDADRENYTEFVRLLREKIPATKEVSVAVAANPNGWTTGWHGSYDYTALAKYADYLMIMSYDESYTGGEAGAVASLPWVEGSLQYAISKNVPTEKIVMGVAHYGRYWMEGASYGGLGISNWQVDELLTKYNGTVVFDEMTKSPKAIVTIKEGDPKTVINGTTLTLGTYTIWYENEESIREKLALVSKYNIRGVGNWSIGQEMDVWDSYSAMLPTKVPITVPVSTTPAAPTISPSYTTYKVVSGDSLWGIATKNHTTVSAIRELNQLSTDVLSIGQILKIPTTGGTTTTTPTTTTAPTSTVKNITYTVVSGDSLSVIAQRYNTTVTALKTANNLTTDTIFIGQVLKIPGT